MKHLTIDIGNTRTKYAIFDNSALIDKGILKHNETSLLRECVRCGEIERVAVSSVKGAEVLIKELEEMHKASIKELTHKTPLPFVNKYATPTTLGSDRLAAMLGAWSMNPNRDFMVIDIGTCITYDLVAEGAFQGGNISLGVAMRARALHDYTAALPQLEIEATEKYLGLSTTEAINCGVYWGCVSEIKSAIERHRRKYPEMRILLTGGGADTLLGDIRKDIDDIVYEPDLIHIGLNYIITE